MKKEIQAQLDSLEMERRSFMDSVKNGEGNFDKAEAEAKVADFDKRRANLEKLLAECDRPVEGTAEKRSIFNKEEMVKAASEKRSITIGNNGTGLINQIKTLFKEVAENDALLNLVSFYYGKDAATNIPVLIPLSDPTYQAEGSDQVGADSAAGVTVTKIEPVAFARVLPVSAEMLTMGAVDIEREIPGIFSKAFNKVMHQQMLTGDGSTGNFRGIFKSAHANSVASTPVNTIDGVSITHLAELAIKTRALDEEYTIVMNPAFYQALLSENSASEDIKLYKESLIRDKSIEGVKIILDSKAPSAATSDAVAIVAAPLSRFAIGVAGEMTIDPIKVKGDTNTYYQATMFFNGKQVADSDVYCIINA